MALYPRHLSLIGIYNARQSGRHGLKERKGIERDFFFVSKLVKHQDTVDFRKLHLTL